MSSGHGGHCCCSHSSSAGQSIEEVDWERGIWPVAQSGENEVLRKKLQSGLTCVDHRDVSGYTALHYASRAGHLSTCRLLVMDFSADVNARTRSGLATPLHRAAFTNRAAVVEFLLLHNANPSLQDDDGKTALHKAAEAGHGTICTQLVTHTPLLVSVADNRGRLPWQCLPDSCSPSLLKVLKAPS